MKDFLKEKTKQLIYWSLGLAVTVTLVLMWLVNDAIPFMMDDIWYADKIISFEPSGIPITSFKDIIDSQIWHYNYWGGRSMTHGLLQMLLQLDAGIVDVLNTLAGLLLAYMMCCLSGVWQKSWKLAGIFCGLGMMLGMNANWMMSMFWQAGAANYLYITSFLLFFLYCYLREDPDNRLWGISIWIIPLGIISGWSNENMGPTVWILSTIVILTRFFQKKKVYTWMALGNISALLGSILVVIAPGNFVRSEEAANEYSALWNLFLRCYAESKAALEFLFPAIALLVAVLIIGKGILDIEIGYRNILLLLGGVLSWGAMVLSPHYPDRATFGTMILLICVIMSMMKKIGEKSRKYAGMMLCLGGLVWLRGMFFLGEYICTIWGWIKF